MDAEVRVNSVEVKFLFRQKVISSCYFLMQFLEHSYCSKLKL